jgi:D-alanyl-D-alanine-carboxypeptidase/D-alanyl-D-alanine-endopeptidase
MLTRDREEEHKMRKVWFLITVLVVLSMLASACAAPTPTATPVPSPMPSPAATTKSSRLPDADEVKALLVQLVDVEKRAPGIVVGMIADDPQERWVVGYGRLSATDERVPDGDTVFEIGSVTKVFTGILLAQAVVNGEVKLDDPISMYLPEGVVAPEYEGRSITLLDLATHTSGLPREAGNLSAYSNYTLDQMYAYLSGYRLTRASGSTFEYSNYGFGLLGNLLVRRAGQADYEALLLDRITGPLGMDSTRIVLTPEMSSRLAAPHMSYSVATISLNMPTLAGCGAIRSTANDMLTFLAANMGLTDTELQPAIQLANTPQRPWPGSGYIGLGVGVPETGQGMHCHTGGTLGYSSYLAWDPQRKIGVVVLANAAVSIDDIAFLLMTESAKLVDTILQVDPQVLAEYAGRYQFPDGSVVTIGVDGTRIFIQGPNQLDLPGQPPLEIELSARSNNQFHPFLFEAEITFYKNDSGEVDRLVRLQGGVITEAKKVP